MQSSLVPRLALLAAGVLAAVAVLEIRDRGNGGDLTTERDDQVVAHSAPPSPHGGIALDAPEPRRVPGAPAVELAQMSETFRNTTFLIAIRAAGFVCDDVVAAHRGGERVWTARCRDLGGYEIEVGPVGDLHVSPMAQYFDAVERVFRREYEFRLDRDPFTDRLQPSPR